jgi:CHAT domain-containing protein
MTVLHLTRQWIKSRPQPDITFWGMGDPIYDPNDDRMTGRSTTKIASSVAEPSPLREIQLREGNASARDPFPRLTYSGEEVRRIGRLLGATDENLLLDLSASEAKVREASASNTLSRARYVHFATHGVLGLGRGQLPALVLSQVGNSQRRDELGTDDGLLQLDEITRLKLNADLVVLSACRSGRGRMRSGEGVSSLARAFLIVGCRGVVCSLWAVADRETADLFTAVYGGLKDGRTSVEALREAKLAHLRSGKAPFYWAPFVLVGGEPGVSAGANPPLTAEVAGHGSKP